MKTIQSIMSALIITFVRVFQNVTTLLNPTPVGTDGRLVKLDTHEAVTIPGRGGLSIYVPRTEQAEAPTPPAENKAPTQVETYVIQPKDTTATPKLTNYASATLSIEVLRDFYAAKQRIAIMLENHLEYDVCGDFVNALNSTLDLMAFNFNHDLLVDTLERLHALKSDMELDGDQVTNDDVVQNAYYCGGYFGQTEGMTSEHYALLRWLMEYDHVEEIKFEYTPAWMRDAHAFASKDYDKVL